MLEELLQLDLSEYSGLLCVLLVVAIGIARLSWVCFCSMMQRHCSSLSPPILSNFGGTKPVKTLIVMGSGGHTAEMVRLVGELRDQYSPRVYYVAQTDAISEDKIHNLQKTSKSEYSIEYIPRSREVKQSWLSTIITTARALVFCLPLLIRQRPDLLLVNGPGTCIPVCLVAFLLKVLFIKNTQIVYIESVCRVETISLTGRIMYCIADTMLVQWPQLHKQYPMTVYMGRLV